MYISELIKKAVNNNLITLDDLYQKTELELMDIFASNFSSWPLFEKANNVIISDKPLEDRFYVHIETKKRNTIPLLQKNGKLIELQIYLPKLKKYMMILIIVKMKNMDMLKQ